MSPSSVSLPLELITLSGLYSGACNLNTLPPFIVTVLPSGMFSARVKIFHVVNFENYCSMSVFLYTF